MFKRKSSVPAVSPLRTPPASTQLPPQQAGLPPNGPTSGPGGPAGQPLGQGAGNQMSSLPSPPILGDTGHWGTSATQRVRSRSDTVKSDKAEKRRSGIFSFGKKDKDKKEDRKEDVGSRQSQSFSVDRPSQAGQGIGGNQYPQRMQQYPAPAAGQTVPSARMTQSQTMRNLSSPPNDTAAQDFGPGYGGMPRSQTLGGQPQPHRQGSGGVPETHPYRGFLTAQQDKQQQPQQQQSGLPRSVSTPAGQSLAAAPPPPTKNGAVSSPTAAGIINTGRSAAPGSADWTAEFDPIVDLIQAQPTKTYVASPPELEMILARTSAGGQPKQGQPGSATNDWDAVWLQLSGISLSMWSMKETRAAAARGEKVPPTYFNITDSSLELLAPLPPPPHRPQSHPHLHVFSLNTAGSNRLLFSCPSETDMARWTTGLRLAAWERARLEEIYTGHLIKSGGREPKNELARGRMEGFVRVRVMGGTEWKRLWMVLSTPEENKDDVKRERRRSFFGIGDKEKETVQEPNTGVTMASFYAEQRTPKNQHIAPVLSIWNVSQAYAVFPERLEVMAQSNLMKVVGKIGGEMVTIEGRVRDSGWALIMPESDAQTGAVGTPSHSSPLSDMMRWVTGVHDAFKLYGRPERYNWDASNPKSLFFAYPKGDSRNRLFLGIDEAMLSDFRTTHLATVRSQFMGIMQKKLSGEDDRYANENGENGHTPPAPPDGNYRLPPLTFDDPRAVDPSQSQPRSLTPITERTDIASRANSSRTGKSSVFGFQGDRKPSVGSTLGSKDGSMGAVAEKKASTSSSRTDDNRLATIADSSEHGGIMTEEPAHVSDETAQPHERAHVPIEEESSLGQAAPRALPLAIDTDHKSIATTSVYSQPSANTPVRRLSPAPLSTIPSANTPLEIGNAAAPLPGYGESGRHDSVAVQYGQARQVSGGESKPLPPLAAPIAAPNIPASPPTAHPETISHVHSPVPRKASSDGSQIGTGLSEEPAAMYLMNMVEEPASATRAALPQSNVRQGSELVTPGASHTPSALSDLPSPASSSSASAARIINPRAEVGRKPSGARALPVKKLSSPSPQLPPVPMEQPEMLEDARLAQQPPHEQSQAQRQHTASSDMTSATDLAEDATTFLAYADHSSPEKPTTALSPISTSSAEAAFERPAIRSSFMPSQAAADRRARAEQQSVDQQRAMHLPGGGRRVVSTAQETWSGSEESEDEDEPPASALSNTSQPLSAARALPPLPPQRSPVDSHPHFQQENHTADALPPTTQFAQLRTSASPAPPQTAQHRSTPHAHRQPSPSQTGAGQATMNPGNRHSVWNANFSQEHGMQPSASGKFLDIEDRDAQLTRAFAPHGLLQAGLQDKEDRSAKRQEELAREMGTSLVNVPAAPPPPSAGLLGAVAQHEKSRQNPGGIGATLTEKENQKRVAEDRQREIERLQRQQMEYARSQGSEAGYGGSQYGGGYGMMPNMGMMGMPQNPYGGYNPYSHQQAMMAAQMAYQQAMMNLGGHGGNSLQPGGPSPDQRAASPAGSVHSASHIGHSPSPPPGFPFGGFGGYPQMNMNMGGMAYGNWPGMGMPMNMGWGGGSPGWQGMPGGPGAPGMFTGGGMPYGMGSTGPHTPHEQDGRGSSYANGASGGQHAS